MHLGAGELLEVLGERLARQRAALRDLESRIPAVEERIRQAARGARERARVLAIAPSMLEHALAHERAELAWLEKVHRRLLRTAEKEERHVVRPARANPGVRRDRGGHR